MTKGPISEVGWDVGVFNLQLLTLNEEAENKLHNSGFRYQITDLDQNDQIRH
jgi:hypothetical protein